MMYAEFYGNEGRPGDAFEGRPISDKDGDITIEDILQFSKAEAASVWAELGLNAITLPTISFGKTKNDFFAETNGNGKIILNRRLLKSWNISQFSQALLMELGNYKNLSDLNSILENVKKYETAESYSEAIERVEFRSIEIIARAVFSLNSVFNPPIWSYLPKSFDDYYNNPNSKEHRKSYEDEWHEINNK
jgi:hypothetical protein